MTQWLFFSLLSPFLWAFSVICDQIIRKHHVKNEHAFAFLAGLFRMGIGFVLGAFFIYGALSLNNIILMLIAGMLYIYAATIYIKALSFEEVSRIAILFQITPVFTLILAVVILDEILTGNQNIAFILLLSGGLLAAMKNESVGIKLSKALPIMLIANLFFALSEVMFKGLSQGFPLFLSAFSFYCLGSGIASFSYLLIPSQYRTITTSFRNVQPRFWLLFVLAMVTGIGGLASFMYAITLEKVALTNALVGVEPLFVIGINRLIAPLSTKVEPENLSKKNLLLKCAALMAIVTGLYLLYA